MPEPETKTKPSKSHLRSIFLRGLAVLFPVYLTFLLLRFMIQSLSTPVAPIIRWLIHLIDIELSPFLLNLTVNTASFILAVGIIIAAGIIAGIVIGRRIITLTERFLSRVPIVRTIYKTFKELTGIVTGQSSITSHKVVMVNLPNASGKVFGFITGVLNPGDGQSYYLVFVPTVPNVSSGFLLLLQPGQFQETTISPEQGMRIVISAGILNQDD